MYLTEYRENAWILEPREPAQEKVCVGGGGWSTQAKPYPP
jgi:hypothetical protein